MGKLQFGERLQYFWFEKVWWQSYNVCMLKFFAFQMNWDFFGNIYYSQWVYQYRGMIKNKSVKLTSNPAEVGSEKFCWITVIPDIHLLVAASNPTETALTSVSI